MNFIYIQSFYALGLLWGVFIFLYINMLIRRHKKIESTESFRRTNTAAVLMLIATALFLFSPKINFFMAVLFTFFAIKEAFSIAKRKEIETYTLYWVYPLIVVQDYLAYQQQLGAFLIFLPLCLYVLLPVTALLFSKTLEILKVIGTLYWCMVFSIFPVSCLLYIDSLPALPAYGVNGASMFLYYIFLMAMNDIAQLIAGIKWGKHQISPVWGPKKTWEGLLGGVLFSILLSCVLFKFVTPFVLKEAILVGAFLAVLGFLGDITISALKRDAEMKDCGTLLPGHGGIFDRIDNLIFSAPCFLLYLIWFYY